MRKTLFRTLLGALLVVCSVGFVGCEQETSAPQEEIKNYDTVTSFEEYYDFYTLYTKSTQPCRVEMNRKDEFITDGDMSLKFMKSTKTTGAASTTSLGVPLKKKDGTSLGDFSRVASVSYDVINPTGTEVVVNTSIAAITSTVWATSALTTTLAENETKRVEYVLDRYQMHYSIGLKNATHVLLEIKGTDPVLYIDNVQIVYRSDEFVTPETSLKEKEICSFEYAFQDSITFLANPALRGEIVIDPANASEGFRYYKLTDSSDVKGIWSRCGFMSAYLASLNLDAQRNSYIAYDIKLGHSGGNCSVVTRMVESGRNNYKNINTNIPADGKWHTVCVPISLAPIGFDTLEISCGFKITEYVALDNFRIVDTPPTGVNVSQ